MAGIAIVGAGECGARTAFALRTRGYSGPITLVGNESHLPYERPPLSKPGELENLVTQVPVASAAAYADADIDLKLATRIENIDRDKRIIQVSDGGINIPYEKLLLTTGASPRSLDIQGVSRWLSLRTIDDAKKIYTKAASGQSAVIVGAGLIGLEMASVLRQQNIEVLVVEVASRALGRSLPEVLSDELVACHKRAGVKFCFDADIQYVQEDGLMLRGGECITADLLISSIGVIPNTALAEYAGLKIENGIRVDHTLVTSDPVIYAAGDCANVDHPRYGRAVRMETWRNACDQALVAAANLMGGSQSYDKLPWFWSDQYALGLQAVGFFDASQKIIRRPLDGDRYLCFGLDQQGQLVAAAGMGPGNSIAKEIKLAERLIEKGVSCDAAALRDPTIQLKRLLKP